MDNLEEYLCFDKPVPYKELEIYPVKMCDYIEFHKYVNCLLLDKNSIPDMNIISMTYLDYIFYLATPKNSDEEANLDSGIYLYLLLMLLCMVLHIDKDDALNKKLIVFDKDEKNDRAFIQIKGKKYYGRDFDKIKKIIAEQNGVELIDETIQKEIREAMEKAQEYKMRQNAYKVCSLEEQMICVLISTSLKLEDIYDLTIRKFIKILRRVDHKLHYEIYLTAQMSGMVKFDSNTIIHWMNDLTKEDKFDDVKVGFEEMQNKLNVDKK